MNCKAVIKNLDGYLNGELEAETRDSLLEHLEVCPECETLVSHALRLLEVLKELPAPTPDEAFVDKLFSSTVNKSKHRPRYYSDWLRLAAGIVLVVALGYLSKATWQPGQTGVPQVIVSMNVKEDIRLVFNSNEDLSGVTFSLEIPKSIELAGYGDKRQIVWQGDLTKGSNLLVLPVIARDSTGGSLIAEISHGQTKRQFNIQLTVDQSTYNEVPATKAGPHKMSLMPI